MRVFYDAGALFFFSTNASSQDEKVFKYYYYIILLIVLFYLTIIWINLNTIEISITVSARSKLRGSFSMKVSNCILVKYCGTA